MDAVEYETLKLIEIQLKRKRDVEDILLRTNSLIQSNLMFTRHQQKNRVESLQKILEEYEETHKQILEKGKVDIPYLANNSGETMIENIRKGIDDVKKAKISEIEPAISSEQPQNSENNELNKKIRLIRLKIGKLQFAIEDIEEELTCEDKWSKELFEVKNKFLQNMWQAISTLDEEIELHEMNLNEPQFDNRICRDVLNNLNRIVRKMSEKISNSKISHEKSGSGVETKLPKLKIPVFKGDFLKWISFKDIFESLISKKHEISSTEKMEYLKTHLEGEPLKLISSYLLTGGNFEDAWGALNNRYSNKRRLLSIHLENMRKPLGKNVTSKNIKEMYDNINEGLKAISNMGIDISTWDPIVIHLAIENLDAENRALFEEKFNQEPNEIPELSFFLKFLESRFKALEILETIKMKNVPKQLDADNSSFHSKSTTSSSSISSCQKCSEEHKLVMCPKFLASSPNSRYRFVKVSKICYRCLQKHGKSNCDVKTEACTKCQSTRHHKLIHLDRFVTTNNQSNVIQEASEVDIDKTLAVISSHEENHEVLGTAIVRAKDVLGNYVPLRILIDTGAQKNYITEGMAQKLQLPREDCSTNVTGIGPVQAFKVRSAIRITLVPHFEDTHFEKIVTALVMGKKVTSKIPDRKISEVIPRSWQQLKLADPSFMNPGEIDMVVGIGFFVNILMSGLQKSNNSNLLALNSKVGWIVFGESKCGRNDIYKNVHSMVSLSDLHEDLSRFWELEEIKPEYHLSEEDVSCEQHYQQTHQRMSDGKYMVRIPFKLDLKANTILGTSRSTALCRFYNLESKFRLNPEIHRDYKKFMDEYKSLGHMKKVFDDQQDQDVYFMPHHCIQRPESSTTKLRVVFDASAKTMNNISLNDVMMSGPRLQDDITCIILRWRFHKFVMSADVEKMYRQIFIAPEDRKYQRIFWRDSPAEKIAVYELSTVTYGTTSAPYLAIKTLQQVAKDDSHKYPEAAKTVLTDFYVDDLMTGRDTIEESKQLQKDVQVLLKGGGMNLRKWTSNNTKILEGLSQDLISDQMMTFGKAENKLMKTLGLSWSPKDDSFMFQCVNRPIKRIIIEGNIGCGKTTLIQSLESEVNIEVLPEPLEKWMNCDGVNLLQKFYDEPMMWAYQFQDYVIDTMVENHVKPSTSEIKVMERSVFSAQNIFLKSLRDSANISETEFKKLHKKCNDLIKIHGITADLIIYLRSDPATAYQRIISRGRKEESNLTLNVIEELHNYHEEYVKKTSIPMVLINANESPDVILRNVLSVLSNEMSNFKTTKRMLCSEIAKIFDPLGWISPLTIVGKMLFQETWKRKIDWNELLPADIQKQWMRFKKNLDRLTEIKIARWLNTTTSSQLELHGFCDASQRAYAASIYVKVSNVDVVAVRLLMAKTKVAPVKQEMTVAKLELCGALLLTRLYEFVVKTFNWQSLKFTAWCDSQITLSWIKGDPSRWKIFVANRVSQIQKSTNKADWRYIPTSQNAADCATRGLSSEELKNHDLWWNGPQWIRLQEECWPSFVCPRADDVPELRRKNVLLLVQPSMDDNIETIVNRYASVKKLKTIVAYCLRFINNCRDVNKKCGALTIEEIEDAEMRILKQVQYLYFKEDIDNILNKKKLNNHNGILSLSPMLDARGVLRIIGRLQNSYLTYDEKHPIILHPKSNLSKLIIRDSHVRCSHGLNSLTEYIVKRRFWIVKGKNLIKTILFHCVICKRRQPKLQNQLMGHLPVARVTLNHAFFSTGVDYAGPFQIKAWKGRFSKKLIKSYVAVFVCMVTKAVHLELVTDLGAECFIAAYRRFSSRRGPCKKMYSDCGTNFVGANSILESEFEEFKEKWKEDIKCLTIEGLEWHFNPPAAPHFGGIWEAAVKSMKNLLVKFFTNTLLTYEEFYTILTQVEGCLNSRPLGFQRDVPEDRAVLTPSHFLTGTTMFTNPDVEAGNPSLLSRWKYIQNLKEEICKEYKIQILHTLQPRKKWQIENINIKVGDIVVLEDNNMFSHKWPLGLVNEVNYGSDGLVRVVTIKTDNGKILKRPIAKVGLLPILK